MDKAWKNVSLAIAQTGTGQKNVSPATAQTDKAWKNVSPAIAQTCNWQKNVFPATAQTSKAWKNVSPAIAQMDKALKNVFPAIAQTGNGQKNGLAGHPSFEAGQKVPLLRDSLLVSLAPGFSRVLRGNQVHNRFSGLPVRKNR